MAVVEIVNGWIQTRSGRKFDLLNPKPEMVDPADIAHALSQICRFSGHCREFYSVAQHCVLVCQLVGEMAGVARPGEKDFEVAVMRAALMHDAGEAYYGDVVRPLKRVLEALIGEDDLANRDRVNTLDIVMSRVDAAIGERFRLDDTYLIESMIKQADLELLATERRDLMEGGPEWSELAKIAQPRSYTIVPLPPAAARDLWKLAYNALEQCVPNPVEVRNAVSLMGATGSQPSAAPSRSEGPAAPG